MNDAERFNWLVEEYEKHGCIGITRIQKRNQRGSICQMFTTPFQHTYGKSLREAIDGAMHREVSKEAYDALLIALRAFGELQVGDKFLLLECGDGEQLVLEVKKERKKC